MNYSGIDYMECYNGENWGCTLFVSGCCFMCKGCQNQQAWDFNYGEELNIEVITNLLQYYKKNPYLARFTICGGEPLHPNNIEVVQHVMNIFKTVLPDIEIWCYTGYTIEELANRYENISEVLSDIDILVDGRFMEELSKPRPLYRGSNNQRIIDIQRTLENGKIILRNVK